MEFELMSRLELGLFAGLIYACVMHTIDLKNISKDLREITKLKDRVFELELELQRETQPYLKGLQRQVNWLQEKREMMLKLSQALDHRLESLEK
jgi:hypothetical protein